MSVTNKIAVVTAGHRGIGLALCELLERDGFQVILTARNLKNASEAAADFSLNSKVSAYALDITDPKSLATFTQALIANGISHVDLLINNAGINIDHPTLNPGEGEPPSLFSADVAVFSKTFETNVVGAYLVTHSLLELLKQAPHAKIINVSSGMGQLTSMGTGWPAYRISKTALNALTRIMSAELSHSGITVNSVCPGWVKTEMGGQNADLTPIESARDILWLAENTGTQTGQFFQNKKQIDW